MGFLCLALWPVQALAQQATWESLPGVTDRPATMMPEQTSQAKVRHADEVALIAHANKPWSGDLDGMLKRGFIRVLTVYNPPFFHYDGAEKKGITYEWTVAFEKELNKSRNQQPPIRILMIPVPRDRLLSGLNSGLGDIAAANLTITPDRQKQVQFSDPGYRNITELVVTQTTIQAGWIRRTRIRHRGLLSPN